MTQPSGGWRRVIFTTGRIPANPTLGVTRISVIRGWPMLSGLHKRFG